MTRRNRLPRQTPTAPGRAASPAVPQGVPATQAAPTGPETTKRERAAAARAAKAEAARRAAATARRRRIAAISAVTMACLAILAGVGTYAVRSARTAAQDDTSSTAFDLPALHGSARVALASFAGRPTVVNFFASWCEACDAELPGFSTVSEQLKGKVNFVGVNALETGDRDYMVDRHHIGWWPLARDVGGANGSGLHDALGGGNSMPLTAFYDAQGKLLQVQRQALPETDLRALLQQLYGVSA